MSTATAFLGGARNRLLPASIPFRFFATACGFHVLAWGLLLAAADDVIGFRGGLGWPLAALHLLTLGVLVQTALGASLQLLPVATGQPVAPVWVLAALWWLATPAVAALTLGMGLAAPRLLGLGTVTLAAALLLYALLLARNLAGARAMPVVRVHGWMAWLSLLVLLASGASMAFDYLGRGWLPRAGALGLHIPFAGYGFMGLLVLGLAYILVPMFALADSPPQRAALHSAAAAGTGLLLAAADAAGLAPRAVPAALAAAAVLAGLAGFGLHLRLMLRAQAQGMRRLLGLPLQLVRLGWATLAASLLAALALALGPPWPRLPQLFVVLLIGGLLSVLFGMLGRIVPFLASMHAPPGRRGPPPPSALTAAGALELHAAAHVAALALLLAALVLGDAGLVRAAATAGLVGAVAFTVFVAAAWRRLRRPRV